MRVYIECVYIHIYIYIYIHMYIYTYTANSNYYCFVAGPPFRVPCAEVLPGDLGDGSYLLQ